MPLSGPGLRYVYTGTVVVSSPLFDRGHNIRRWADGIARNFEVFVKEEAPVNKRPNTGHGAPGGLKEGLGTFVERVGPKHLVTSVFSAAPYTAYVAGGTQDIIVPTGGRAMRLPSNPGFGAASIDRAKTGRDDTLHRTVRGQQRNQFFERAFIRTAARHPSLRPAMNMAFRVTV